MPEKTRDEFRITLLYFLRHVRISLKHLIAGAFEFITGMQVESPRSGAWNSLASPAECYRHKYTISHHPEKNSGGPGVPRPRDPLYLLAHPAPPCGVETITGPPVHHMDQNDAPNTMWRASCSTQVFRPSLRPMKPAPAMGSAQNSMATQRSTT